VYSDPAWHRARAAQLAEVRSIVAWMRQVRGYGWMADMERDGVMSEELPSEWSRGVSRPRPKYLERLRQYAERHGYVRECSAAITTVGDSLLLAGRSPTDRTVDILREEAGRSEPALAAASSAALAALQLIHKSDTGQVSELASRPPTPLDDNDARSPAPPGSRVGEESSRGDAYVVPRLDFAVQTTSRPNGSADPTHAPTKHNLCCAGAAQAESGGGSAGSPGGTAAAGDGRTDGGSAGADPHPGGRGENPR